MPQIGDRFIESNGYASIYMPEHPRAHNGRVLEHIMLAEQALGKTLPKGVEVHHFDTNTLVICQDRAYHDFLHSRQEALKYAGNADARRCRLCSAWDIPKPGYMNVGFLKGKKHLIGFAYHLECHRQKQKQLTKNKPCVKGIRTGLKKSTLERYYRSYFCELFESQVVYVHSKSCLGYCDYACNGDYGVQLANDIEEVMNLN